jgi:hypothetical protein
MGAPCEGPSGGPSGDPKNYEDDINAATNTIKLHK